MSEKDMEKVQQYFEAALAVPAEQRADFLADLSSTDTELGREVSALLKADSQSKLWDSDGLLNTRVENLRVAESIEKIGPYQIIEQIGSGGMGVIYKAYDTRLDRHIAIKFLPASLNNDSQIRQRFLAEARAASQLDHPNICVIYDVGETADGQLYIIMPCYEGETLAKRCSRGPLPRQDAVDIALKIAEGLASAHAHNIVHRDVKPANIMLTHDGGVKILDFGIAKVSNNHLTQTGMSIGTLAYMSPEQLRGEEIDVRTDVWSLGVVLYELLTGQKAFPANALPEILRSVLDEDSPIPQIMSANLPQPLYHVLQHALSRDLQQRFASMVSMHDALFEAHQYLNSHDSDNQTTKIGSASITQVYDIKKPRSYAWDEAVLDRISEILLPFLGPVAPVLVQRKAKSAADINELHSQLTESLPDPSSRKQFTRQMEKQVTALTSPPMPRSVKTDGCLTGVDLSATQLADIEAELISHLGPIAQTLIRRHAVNASSLQQLFDTLSQHLNNSNDKSIFMQKMNKLFATE